MMQDTRDSQGNAVPASTNSSPENLEVVADAMWRLKVRDGEEDEDTEQNPYPDRPGERDCIYYLRTGSCGYGSNCRYNHPAYRGEGEQYRGELPERLGQPACQYFLRTGTCKFGAACKYHHPCVKHDAQPVSLNILGLPMRQEEKLCPYYMRTGSCKFGIVCKFNHPQPASLGATTLGVAFPVTGPSTYGSSGSSVAPPSSVSLISGYSPWSLTRNPYTSSPRMPGFPAYMPFVLPASQVTMPLQQGWNTYTAASGVPMNLPERPDQPQCQYYMKTGSCKFGSTCKYHHPKERNACTLGPHGLPMRPDHAACSFYSMYGVCKFGSACKFDHPVVGYYNFSMPVLPVLDPSAVYTGQSNLPSKTSPRDRLIKSEATSNGVQAQTTSSSQTDPSSESPHDHSD